LTFLATFGGLPRLRRINSCVAFPPINPGGTLRRRPRLGEILRRHSGLSLSGREARSSVALLAIQSHLSSVCFAEADHPQILAARRHDTAWSSPSSRAVTIRRRSRYSRRVSSRMIAVL
jgi:hypothetical protein